MKKITATKRTTGRKLQVARAELFQREPLCAHCLLKDVFTVATQRDHIVPLEEGGSDTVDNTQGLCVDCHEEKSLQERLRARRRAAGRGGGRKSAA